MFEKFLNSEDCMKILTWLLVHSEGEYSAAIIGVECDIVDMAKYMAVLSVLEGVGFIKIDDLSEEVMIQLDKESSITQLLMTLKDEFNDKAFHSEHVSPSLAYLYSNQLKQIVDAELFNQMDIEGIVDMCKNYKDLDLKDEKNNEIYKLCSKLEETGEYDEFITRLEKGLEK